VAVLGSNPTQNLTSHQENVIAINDIATAVSSLSLKNDTFLAQPIYQFTYQSHIDLTDVAATTCSVSPALPTSLILSTIISDRTVTCQLGGSISTSTAGASYSITVTNSNFSKSFNHHIFLETKRNSCGLAANLLTTPKGLGSESDPWLICTKDQFITFSKNRIGTDPSDHFRLGADINVAGETLAFPAFSGVLKGSGFIISGGDDHLFVQISDGSIVQNLALSNWNLTTALRAPVALTSSGGRLINLIIDGTSSSALTAGVVVTAQNDTNNDHQCTRCLINVTGIDLCYSNTAATSTDQPSTISTNSDLATCAQANISTSTHTNSTLPSFPLSNNFETSGSTATLIKKPTYE
jgi:hypothetical protein